MVAGGVSNPELGGEVVARLQPWIDMVEHKLRDLLAGSVFEALVPPRDVAFAIIALYLGVDMLSHLRATMPGPSRCSTSAFATRRSQARCCPPNERKAPDERTTRASTWSRERSATPGRRSPSGCSGSGRAVRTLTFHPDRPHALRGESRRTLPLRRPRGARPQASRVSRTLYNTYWVRFDHGATTFANAIANSRTLFHAARRAGVARIVHVSIANPSIDSTLPYYRGKALVERALAEVDVPYSIVRPTWIFGGDRDILANNIAWILRRMPIFALPGNGRYPVQPVHIEDLARICEQAAHAQGDVIIDAAGPETMSFAELVQTIREAVGTRSPILHLPPRAMAAVCARARRPGPRCRAHPG